MTPPAIHIVIPAKAGNVSSPKAIQEAGLCYPGLDSRVRGNDEERA
jgi:hypothetical protein